MEFAVCRERRPTHVDGVYDKEDGSLKSHVCIMKKQHFTFGAV
jgi:hypothetical protein